MSQRSMVPMQCHTGALARVMTRLVLIFIYIFIVELILFVIHSLEVEWLSVALTEAFSELIPLSFLVGWH